MHDGFSLLVCMCGVVGLIVLIACLIGASASSSTGTQKNQPTTPYSTNDSGGIDLYTYDDPIGPTDSSSKRTGTDGLPRIVRMQTVLSHLPPAERAKLQPFLDVFARYSIGEYTNMTLDASLNLEEYYYNLGLQVKQLEMLAKTDRAIMEVVLESIMWI